LVSTQEPEQSVCPVGQAHIPLVQILLLVHFEPHLPQLWASVLVSTQEPEQLVCPVGHESEHWPLAQTSSDLQAVPQVPQCLWSVLVSTQEPEQSVCPVGQAHIPLVQILLSVHFEPHLPQLSLDIFGLIHLLPQSI
jgi:hypothetical protein